MCNLSGIMTILFLSMLIFSCSLKLPSQSRSMTNLSAFIIGWSSSVYAPANPKITLNIPLSSTFLMPSANVASCPILAVARLFDIATKSFPSRSRALIWSCVALSICVLASVAPLKNLNTMTVPNVKIMIDSISMTIIDIGSSMAFLFMLFW